MKRLRWLFALPALLIATTGASQAAEIRDKASLFSSEAVKKAEAELDRIEKEYKVPVTIETIDSLEGQPIRDVTTKHAEQAGAKGIYILIAKGEGKIFAEASKAYRTALTRERLQAVDEAFVRQFKKKDFDAGLLRGVSQIETTVTEARPVAKSRQAGQAPVVVGKPSSGGMSMWLTIGLGLLALFIVIRVLGALLGGGNRGYAGQQRMMGPGGGGMGGGPGYGPGYGGGGGGGGGFMSSMFGGIGGALAGNWLYDQFSGRHHDSSLGQTGYDPAAGTPPADAGPEWGAGGAEGDWGGGGDAGGAGGDWGGGGGDVGGGGDWGGGGGGDWGGGGGGDDGGSW
jgi:uncharacterized protein